MKVNDKVTLKTDDKKIIYVIEEIKNEFASIYGMSYRIKRHVNINDLELATTLQIENEEKISKKYHFKVAAIRKRSQTNHLLGKILHIDGDKNYLDKCLELYKEIGVFAYGVNIDEGKMVFEIENLILQTNPDIIVITGHDLYNGKGKKELNNYSNTINYMNVIKKIREKKSSYDICIIAGACQSNYEALIGVGADFASSPKRINIHTFDPAVIAIKVATTSFRKIVDIEEIYKYIEDGKSAYGGLETLGKMRLIYD